MFVVEPTGDSQSVRDATVYNLPFYSEMCQLGKIRIVASTVVLLLPLLLPPHPLLPLVRTHVLGYTLTRHGACVTLAQHRQTCKLGGKQLACCLTRISCKAASSILRSQVEISFHFTTLSLKSQGNVICAVITWLQGSLIPMLGTFVQCYPCGL